MKRAARGYWTAAAVIVGFALLSTLLGVYILGKQRLTSPFASRYQIRVAFSATPGIAPGLGQPADVAGVPVGEISAAAVRNGESLVTLSIERSQLPHVYKNATAQLVPQTPLDDLDVDLNPGSKNAGLLPSGAVIGIGRSTVPVPVDDLLDALDGDTRDYLAALISATGYGLRNQGPNLRALFAQIGPTADQIRELTTALNQRRTTLAKVIHSLSVLAVAAGSRNDELRQIVADGSKTLTALASQDSALQQSLRLLPSTLGDTRAALSSATTFAGDLRPTLSALTPALENLPKTLRATQTLASHASPALRNVIRPAVASGNLSLPSLLTAAHHLNLTTPDLDNAFKVLQYVFNELFYSDNGKSRSYAFWGAWAQHDGNSVLSTGDAQGEVINSALLVTCSEFNDIPQLTTVLDGVGKLLPSVCPPTGEAH